MKKTILLLALLSLLEKAYSQWPRIFFDTLITFEQPTKFIKIDSSNHSNLWQIGKPNKSYFDSAYSVSNAIITDTFNNYTGNNTSAFEFTVKLKNIGIAWGSGELSFWHKFDMDSLFDGGYIEVLYDTNKTPLNIIYDTLSIQYYPTNFYKKQDTISGKIPAFTGRSNGWVQSKFQWVWLIGVKKYKQIWEIDSLRIRFVFKSNSNKTNYEGWMIDNIGVTIYEPVGGVNELYNQEALSAYIYPNPLTENSILTMTNPGLNVKKLEIYNIIGVKVKEIVNIKHKQLALKKAEFCPGIYYYRITSDNNKATSGNFIVD
ncbi:MAG: T9SS type A sorting domain-containing protein [Bacteroidales bacterium]|nr:T9SS type A sorting domain-containing protein [Bacteroidales bacterium]